MRQSRYAPIDYVAGLPKSITSHAARLGPKRPSNARYTNPGQNWLFVCLMDDAQASLSALMWPKEPPFPSQMAASEVTAILTGWCFETIRNLSQLFMRLVQECDSPLHEGYRETTMGQIVRMGGFVVHVACQHFEVLVRSRLSESEDEKRGREHAMGVSVDPYMIAWMTNFQDWAWGQLRQTPGVVAPGAPRPPLADSERAVLDIIVKQPKGAGIMGKSIVAELSKRGYQLEHSTLTRHIIPQLKAHYGVRNRRNVGYYVEST